jgi:hypothetical protein
MGKVIITVQMSADASIDDLPQSHESGPVGEYYRGRSFIPED